MTRVRARKYKRISDDREGREIGVGRQDVDCDALAQRLDLEIVGDYTDNDVGASTLSKGHRPQYEQLLADAAADPGSCIIAYSMGRITRRPAEWEDLIRLYEQHRVVIHTVVSGSVNLATADGRGVARTIAAWDAAEAERIGERVKVDVVRRANAGLPHGGTRAFGWTASGELHPYEHPILLSIIDRALAGESLKSLGRSLYEDHVPRVRWHPPLALSPWPYPVIRKMLTNPRIAGFRTHLGEIVGKAEWPAAVPEETWRQLVALFSDPERHSGGSPGRVHLLTGLALCDQCDKPIGIRNSSSKTRGKRRRYHCETCGLYRAVEPVDAYVEEAIITVLEHYDEEPPTVDAKQKDAVEKLRRRIDEVRADFAADDEADTADYRETIRLLRGRLAREEAKLAPPRRHHVVRGVTGPEAASSWAALSLARKRAILGALVEIRLRRAPAGRKPFDPESVQILER